MRIIVCGSRSFADYPFFKKKMDQLTAKLNRRKLVVVSGGARGTDRLAEQWCFERMAAMQIFLPDYDQYGKDAPLMRNKEMISSGASYCIAFWNGSSPGTKHTIELASKKGIKVRIINVNGDER